ncbi:MAG: hypothetical protein HQK62_10815 [Desulfamplus sp.]|nr:hypothetical protein [Desulfamplus sp.]
MGRGVYLIRDIPNLLEYLSKPTNSSTSPEHLTPQKLKRSIDKYSLTSTDRYSLTSTPEFTSTSISKDASTYPESESSGFPAYIQEYIPHDRDIRIVIIGKEIVLAYWRVSHSNDFRANLSCGGEILFAQIPKKALELALHTAARCGWDDVGLDIIEHKGEFFVIEANMKYGRKGFIKADIDYSLLLEDLISAGKI